MYSRMIVGYRLSNSLCTESCKSALEDALLKYGTPLILNSDQGSQFTSESWVKTLAYYKIKISMTGKGRCADNAYIERLWRAFKYLYFVTFQNLPQFNYKNLKYYQK